MGKSESGDGQEGYQDPKIGSNDEYHYDVWKYMGTMTILDCFFEDTGEEEHKIRVAQLATSLHLGCKKMERE